MARSGSPIVDTLALFAVVFALQGIAAMFSLALVAGLFVLAPPLQTNPWTIVTSVYAHANVSHLLSNSVALVLFGWPVARATSRLRFHIFFVVTGAIAGVSQIVLTGYVASMGVLDVAATSGVLGASGAVFALLGYLLASNRLTTGVAGLVEVPWWLTGLAFLVVATVVTITTGSPNTALLAHFTGLLVGLVAGKLRVLNVSPANRPTPVRT